MILFFVVTLGLGRWHSPLSPLSAMSHGLVTLGVMLHILLLVLLQITSRMPLLRRAILWAMVM